MDEKLDFSLPAKKQNKSFLPIVTVVLLIILIGLTIFNILTIPQNRNNSVKSDSALSSEQVKQLAAQLTSRNLYTRAAEVWQDYLSRVTLPDNERAKTLFQIGTLYEEAGNYAQAIEYFYRSEITAKLQQVFELY